jgi:hypothetical protein
MPPPVPPLAAPLFHPSHSILAIDTAGQACSVTYMYGAAQAMALASLSSKTPFDPRSLDLPSIAALVGFYHACLGFPVCWGLYSYGMSMDRPYLKLEFEAKRSLLRETISPLDFHS